MLVSQVLQTGGFHWPRAHDGVMRLSASQASALFEGLQWSKMHTPRTQVPVTTR
ncbi:MAG: IS66 family insertion sequence element accessory protein TnpB [Sphingobium sp.]